MLKSFFGCAVLIWVAIAAPAFGQTISSISPTEQRVYDFIEIRGSGFGSDPTAGEVRFSTAATTITSGMAYVWRDDYIKVRVPPGGLVGGAITPLPKTTLDVTVAVGPSESAPVSLQIVSQSSGSLIFEELTRIDPATQNDVSTVLGSPNHNLARSKDADLADVNQDGFMDIFDNNSNNAHPDDVQPGEPGAANDTFSALRINNQDKTFRAVRFEKRYASDSGDFAAEIPSGAEHFGNGVSYDADFADVNNDGLPDLIHTASMANSNRVRIFLNDAAEPGMFDDVTTSWFPGNTHIFAAGQFPDDLDHVDANNDGFIDFAVTLRKRDNQVPNSVTKVFLNNGGTSYNAPQEISVPTGWSTHDAFFMDADHDGDADLVLCNESPAAARSQLYVNNGGDSSVYASAETTPALDSGGSAIDLMRSEAGLAADLNGDGWDDFVLAGVGARVYLNRRTSPPTFQEITLSTSGGGTFYDVELGDIDLDGDVDIFGAVITTTADNSIMVWTNDNGDVDGDGVHDFPLWTDTGATNKFPGLGSFQRLSTDLLDFDNDGDLELYVTGADGQSVDGRFGNVPNQLFENKLRDLNIVTPLTTNAAYAGTSADGRKVLVRIQYGQDVPGLGPGSFVVFVDGSALPSTDTIVATKVEQEYWLLVKMPALPAGRHDLEIALNSNLAIRDREPASLEYDDARFFDRVLSIDRTGSMNGDNKMLSAQTAGKLFVDLCEDDDQIGVVSFKRDSDDGDGVIEQHELARDDFALVPASIGVMDQRPAARAAIDVTFPDGMGFPYETSIGAGLRQAITMANSSGNPDNEWEIVLISDGRENESPKWRLPPDPVVSELLANPQAIRVHTVAIGSDAAVEVLQDIATTTGGTFHNLFEGQGSFFLLSRLADTYKSIDESSRGEQRFFYQEDLPNGLGEFFVEPGMRDLSVAFHWNQDNRVKDVILIDPDGNRISHNPPNSTAFGDPKHRTYRVRRPTAGTWRYRTGADQGGGLEFFAVASAITDLEMRCLPTLVRPKQPTPTAVLRVMLSEHEPIPNANIVGVMTLPNREKVKVQFFDDGRHSDGLPKDGLYAAVVEHELVGAYSVRITAKGNAGRDFTRMVDCAFVFPSENPDRPGQPEPFDDPELIAELERCLAELRECRRKVSKYENDMQRSERDCNRLDLQVRQLNEIVVNLRSQIKKSDALNRQLEKRAIAAEEELQSLQDGVAGEPIEQ